MFASLVRGGRHTIGYNDCYARNNFRDFISIILFCGRISPTEHILNGKAAFSPNKQKETPTTTMSDRQIHIVIALSLRYSSRSCRIQLNFLAIFPNEIQLLLFFFPSAVVVSRCSRCSSRAAKLFSPNKGNKN